MSQTQQTTINQAIKLLQSLLTGGHEESAAPGTISIPEYDAQISSVYQRANNLQPEIQQLTQIFKKASTSMKNIASYSQVCKKYSLNQQEKLKNIFMSLSNDVEGIIKKNPIFIDHCKAVKQILGATFWVFVPTPEFIIKGAVEGADFNALKFQKKKVKEHNDWWGALTGACKNLQKFVVKNYPMGLSFNPKGEDRWDQLISGQSGQSVQANKSTTQQKPSTEQKQKRIFLTNKVSEPTKVAKLPKKQMVGMTWQIRNYEGQKINLSNQVQMKHGIFIQNCSNCQIKIDSKFKSLQLNKCENITLTVKSCVSGVELMNSKNLTVVIKQKTPSVSVDKCDRVNLLLNEINIETDIVSCRAGELNVSFEKSNGEESKQQLISDQLITKWNAKTNKFETKVYDKFL